MKSEPQVAEQSGKTNNAFRLQEIARLRMIVGFLGEKGQHNWWSSEFFSATAPAFLNPVFGKTTTLAQYHGVKEAARRVHDEHIGVGRVFHLFRLPEPIEQVLFEMLQEPVMTDALRRDIASQDAAAAGLQAIAVSAGPLQEGPVQIGVVSDLESTRWLSEAARCYKAAFNAGLRSFPYIVGRV
jgi:hypothetical protein